MARKSPLQERARESRERVLTSATELFSERGVVDTSTNRIAEHAGMSIGTLYRYFDDKHQIVHELRQRLLTELEERFSATVLGNLSLPPEEGIAVGLRGIIDTLVVRRGLVLALAGQVTVGDTAFLGAMERRLLVLTRAYLLHVLGPRPDDELDVRAYLMVTIGLATTLRIGLQAPPDLDRDQLVDEAARMLAAWLAAG
jgi:AcrR family transcriptional regulator